MRFSWVTESAALDALAEAWTELARGHATDLQLFQTYPWVRTWWRHFGAKRRYDLRVLVGHEGAELAFVWPLMRTRWAGVHALEQIGNLLSPYDDALARRELDRDACFDGAWDAIRARGDVDLLHLRGVHADSWIAPGLARRASEPVGETVAPVVEMREFGDFDAYFAARGKKVRSELRRSRRKLEELGALEGGRVDAADELAGAVEALFDFKARWLRARGLSGKMVMSAPGQAFVREVCARPGDGESRARPVVDALRCDGALVAVGVGFEFRGRHYEYLDAFEDAVERCGPGRLRLARGIRDAFDRSCHAYDLLTPATQFKTIWTDVEPRARIYSQPLGLRGRIYRDVYLRRARPWIKKGYNSRFGRWARQRVSSR